MMHARTLYDQGYFEESQRVLATCGACPTGLTDDIRRESTRILRLGADAWRRTEGARTARRNARAIRSAVAVVGRRLRLRLSVRRARAAREADRVDPPGRGDRSADRGPQRRRRSQGSRSQGRCSQGQGSRSQGQGRRSQGAAAVDTVAAMGQHQGAALLAAGRIAEAIMRSARRATDCGGPAEMPASSPCALATLAEAHRRLWAAAERPSCCSTRPCRSSRGTRIPRRPGRLLAGLPGETPKRSRTARAGILEEARAIQTTVDGRVGRVRTLLLEARLACPSQTDPARADRIRRRVMGSPAPPSRFGPMQTPAKESSTLETWTALRPRSGRNRRRCPGACTARRRDVPSRCSSGNLSSTPIGGFWREGRSQVAGPRR